MKLELIDTSRSSLYYNPTREQHGFSSHNHPLPCDVGMDQFYNKRTCHSLLHNHNHILLNVVSLLGDITDLCISCESIRILTFIANE